jgi:molecular chaperone GrpE
VSERNPSPSGRRSPGTPPPSRQQGESQGAQTPAPPNPKSASESAGPAPKSPSPSVDPELAADLGPELELRGDVLEEQLVAMREEAALHRDRALRAQAEFENFRKRITREREEERRRAGERLVSEMLPAVDNLERAIAHAEAGGDPGHLLGAVEAVYAQLQGVLTKEGVEIIDPDGEPFDPNTQQAVSQKEDDAVPEGTVVDVFQKGYMLGGRVIRSAMVVVSTGGPARRE